MNALSASTRCQSLVNTVVIARCSGSDAFLFHFQESVDFAARIERMLRLSLGVDLSAEVCRLK